ncbi:Cytochrome c [Rosistilla ulvae]|uniref:Cytochrome c n=1 Tax=Rosistilla ulvae TaxID=1930277 RepID=A0A517LXM1_9BACT|nr:PVC-type heme-binding CxxCH protein [Rosistilla ulvae]QDS87363.1 Cytochrome c [Rosistilla ulvae]
MPHRDLRYCFLSWIVSLAVCCGGPVFAVKPPQVLDPDWQIELLLSESDLVTPTGCCVDPDGNLMVIECHTHFPPENYRGPKTDRIYRIDDSDGDGVPDRKRLFYEQGQATMAMVALTDGWFAVATRSEVVRIRDSDGDRVADQREVLLQQKTTATYPHNGLSGLAVGPDGWLYVGQGENLGEPYELIATDGSRQRGEGEGGNIFRCTFDGRNLQRVATGFWNPFGITLDPAGRLWTVGNDPDAMPPCRLIHVVKGADYGFQFRFGRAGTHPLQAWNGELPGTLPMAAGTGEAPCDVIAYGDRLWVTSWGDNRIERYRPQPQGATWTSETEVFVQGDASFRPVAMATAADGSVYITDWADRSYPVHGKGRVWRLSRKAAVSGDAASFPALTAAETEAERIEQGGETTVADRLKALQSDDAFLRQAALFGLVQSGQLADIDREALPSTQQREGLLTAWRWQQLTEPASVTPQQRDALLTWGLSDTSTDVANTALRWATEQQCKHHLPAIRQLLRRDAISPQLFSAVVASIAYLENGSAARGVRDPAREKLLLEFAGDSSAPVALRAMAIEMLPSESKQPKAVELGRWIVAADDRDFGLQGVRMLAARGGDADFAQLAKLATTERVDLETRADAIAGLARNAGPHAVVLNKMSLPRQPEVLRREALRVLKQSRQDYGAALPNRDDLDRWNELVGSGGDPEAGRRVFFRTACVNCHSHRGRGATTGPDLTSLSGQMTPRRVLESILHPSKEVGPLYVPWQVVTIDGRVLTGLKLDKAGAGNSLRLQGADGLIFEVPLADIDTQLPIQQSIMPTGLEGTMSVEELRDLIAFLVQPTT